LKIINFVVVVFKQTPETSCAKRKCLELDFDIAIEKKVLIKIVFLNQNRAFFRVDLKALMDQTYIIRR
jgi:hypothetical protein